VGISAKNGLGQKLLFYRDGVDVGLLGWVCDFEIDIYLPKFKADVILDCLEASSHRGFRASGCRHIRDDHSSKTLLLNQ